MEKPSLPVPVLNYPHWRVNIRPTEYRGEILSKLGECEAAVRKASVRLRGWDFPHIKEVRRENSFVSSAVSVQSLGIHEYWRFYQSTQFVHLQAIREFTKQDWKQKLLAMTGNFAGSSGPDKYPGCLSILNVLYTFVEIFEFAARLAEVGVYSSEILVRVQIRGIDGFVLMTEANRCWPNAYVFRGDEFDRSRSIVPAELIGAVDDHALKMTFQLFDRFGWDNPSVEVFRKEMQNLREQRL
ncbi:MAG: hypothetical protein KAS72_15755 [Phycisphaerales bacterium]|nr:hypothetical protein [Phycisphaerales bacterium]